MECYLFVEKLNSIILNNPECNGQEIFDILLTEMSNIIEKRILLLYANQLSPAEYWFLQEARSALKIHPKYRNYVEKICSTQEKHIIDRPLDPSLSNQWPQSIEESFSNGGFNVEFRKSEISIGFQEKQFSAKRETSYVPTHNSSKKMMFSREVEGVVYPQPVSGMIMIKEEDLQSRNQFDARKRMGMKVKYRTTSRLFEATTEAMNRLRSNVRSSCPVQIPSQYYPIQRYDDLSQIQ